jgi:hypothetical protein
MSAMDIIDQAKKLEAQHFVMSILGFVGVISPGFLILFIFKRDLFISLDVLKLILLSVSLSLPIVWCNFSLWAALSGDSEGAKSGTAGTLVMALLISSVVVYLPLVVTFLWGLGLHTYVWILVVLEIILAVTAILISIVDSLKKKN